MICPAATDEQIDTLVYQPHAITGEERRIVESG